MFTATGVGYILKNEQIKKIQYAEIIILNFKLITKDPYKIEKYHYVNVSLTVPLNEAKTALETIVPGTIMQVRLGELSGTLSAKGYVFNQIKTRWKWIEVLAAFPNKEVKEDIKNQ